MYGARVENTQPNSENPSQNALTNRFRKDTENGRIKELRCKEALYVSLKVYVYDFFSVFVCYF